jgi:nicotinate-nucleotide pyrophosphorylase (carboxylating)
MNITFTPAETAACCRLIEMALQEDLGDHLSPDADITSACFVDPIVEGAATLVARGPGVLAGLPAAALVFVRVDPTLKFDARIQDGAVLNSGDHIATITGLMTSILAAERTALNFVQQLSGIATLTHQYAQAVAGFSAKILDTRKTTPGWRLLAKYAVRQGGGYNHRIGLYDMVLIKDNHWAAMLAPRMLKESFCHVRKRHPELSIEIEVESLAQLDEVLPAGPDMVLLDNMPPDRMREAVRRRDAVAPGVLLEASGGVNLQTVRAVAETGVDRISVGALTHSAPALDIALDYEHGG